MNKQGLFIQHHALSTLTGWGGDEILPISFCRANGTKLIIRRKVKVMFKVKGERCLVQLSALLLTQCSWVNVVVWHKFRANETVIGCNSVVNWRIWKKTNVAVHGERKSFLVDNLCGFLVFWFVASYGWQHCNGNCVFQQRST